MRQSRSGHSLPAKGFTLLELLIVVAMVGALVAVAVPQVKTLQTEGDRVRAEGDLRTIQTAVESYFITKREANNLWINKYPETSDALCATYLISMAPVASRTTGPILIAGTLFDPFIGKGNEQEYRYLLSPNARDYVIFSAGPNHKYELSGINNDGKFISSNSSAADDIYVTNGQQ